MSGLRRMEHTGAARCSTRIRTASPAAGVGGRPGRCAAAPGPGRAGCHGAACPRACRSSTGHWGAGWYPGSVTLLGGDPGIGKSTLLLQAAAALSAGHPGAVRQRRGVGGADRPARPAPAAAGPGREPGGRERPGARSSSTPGRSAPRCWWWTRSRPCHRGEVAASAGAVSQLRECTAALVRFAKATATAVIIVGHVTKEGAIAGPRVLEHLVDTVLYFESEAGSRYPHRARGEEPLRGRPRAGVLRHDRHGSGRGAQSGRHLPGARPGAGRGQHRHRDPRRRPPAC